MFLISVVLNTSAKLRLYLRWLYVRWTIINYNYSFPCHFKHLFRFRLRLQAISWRWESAVGKKAGGNWRFISNHGFPKEIWSDNGTNFTGAARETHFAIGQWSQDHLNKCLLKDEIHCSLCPLFQWKLQPPSASHMNEVWERMIQNVHKTMKAIGHTINLNLFVCKCQVLSPCGEWI